MKVYTDRNTAPLRFHKFLIWFSLPLGALVSLSAAIAWFSKGDAGRYLFDTIYYLLHVLLSILCLAGMWRWKPYGPKALIARQILEIVNQLSLTLSNIGFGRPVEDSLTRMLGVIIATSIFWVYYKKRMPLFSSKSAAPHPGAPSPSVPPVLYAEPEKIPRKYSGTLYTLTGKTQNDLEVLQSLFEHSSSKASSVMDQMDKIGNNPGSPERESLAHKFLSASYVKQCTSYMFAAIIPKDGPLPRQELFPDLLRNVQFEWDNMCDLIKDLQFLQVELAALSDDSPRQTDLKAQISKLEENISDSQIRIYCLYRM